MERVNYFAFCGAPVVQDAAVCSNCGNLPSGAPRPAPSGNDSKAIVIAIVIAVGGLVLVAVIGIVAAIAIPSFITSQERSKQARTMADIRSIGTAIERPDALQQVR